MSGKAGVSMREAFAFVLLFIVLFVTFSVFNDKGLRVTINDKSYTFRIGE
jgi:hypothetical protein